MLLIGSLAAKINDPQRRNFHDYDIIATESEYNETLQRVIDSGIPYKLHQHDNIRVIRPMGLPPIEFELAIDDYRSPKLLLAKVTKTQDVVILPIGVVQMSVADDNVLATIKYAHIYYGDGRWYKHIKDLHTLCSDFDKLDWDLVRLRRKENARRRGKLHTPTLKGIVKSSFFTDNLTIPAKYDHDSLHYCVMHHDRPIYEMIQEPGHEVECSRLLWEQLPRELKIQCCLEEAYVLSLERILIPHREQGITDPLPPELYASEFSAFHWSLMRICTTITSGWFRDFAVQNYPDIIAAFNPDYWDRFLNGSPILLTKENDYALRTNTAM